MGNPEYQKPYDMKKEIAHHHPIDVVFVATTSSRRIEAITHACPNVQLFFLPGGEESQSLPPEDIADQKAQRAKNSVMQNIYPAWEMLPLHDPKRVGYLGADTVTYVPKRNGSELFHEQQGKIDTLSQLFNTFFDMERGGSEKKEHRTYYVHSGTSFHNGGDPEKKLLEVKIELQESGVKHLATPEGREQYLNEFYSFYSSSLYPRQKPPTPWDVSAGFSLPVFQRLGMVHAIDGICFTDKRYPDIFRNALYIAAIGYDLDILNKIDSSASDRLTQWNWLQDVTDMSLKK